LSPLPSFLFFSDNNKHINVSRCGAFPSPNGVLDQLLPSAHVGPLHICYGICGWL
jgi:hypothetical protein